MGNRLKHLKELSDHERQEMLVLFSESNNAILTFQERQWKATNYSLLILGVLFTCSRILPKPEGSFFAVDYVQLFAHAVLYIFAGITWALTWIVLDKLEMAISTARDTNDTTVFALSPRFQRANYPEGPPSKDKRTTLLHLFRFVLSSGFFIVTLLLFFSAGGI